MLIGIAAALFACFGYGTASVLQGYGARQSSTEVGMAADHGPSLKSTVAAALTPAFIAGMALDLVGFAGSLVSARLIPLFLSQTIMSANLVVTAVLGIAVLGFDCSGGTGWPSAGLAVAVCFSGDRGATW